MRKPSRLRRAARRTLAAAGAILLLLASAGLRADPPGEPRLLTTWGERGEGPGQFHSPIHVAINARDEVYVADLNNSRIQKFTADGAYLGGFDLPLDSPPRKSCIVGGLALDDRGLIYVSFMNQHRIAVYDDAGAVVREWGRRGPGDGEFHQPGGMVLRRDGTLYVADQCNHRIQKFTIDGRFLGEWGGHGSEPGRFGGAIRRVRDSPGRTSSRRTANVGSTRPRRGSDGSSGSRPTASRS
ncbi:hypothetical protein [Planctomyces sp. SH-PL62]|uniref:hypothetical protein n=1 Tax=Planctomyces sp. SH-PL62 TaxID=1636152 RepID=UPI00078C7539|nr:hypothetical protein [Planctomyces sp. SH-PL62]AMV36246.1 NHL repeat protein [Planctomyces sp. SH-PL62]